MERAIVYEKVYSTKDGNPVNPQVGENIVSTICNLFFFFFFMLELFIESNMLFGSCVKTG